ncbi:adenylyltransferase/cytidyltransferase family protein [Endozoicomonas sp. 8E]|uniref:adenylyltransferase/cytidyltransferase family protein n=1 Tax=Endozoicomonas sp. 8E TaxID=3035692 RepID=UPI002939065F|nr:adenylyltransferase/cytidyltransferase family protein [Endozoicomonas sp. 8E]WOG28001.1 adenylyltransferase/cytidyltransferase family protein [Endozoicomonas sp. 8E]
MTARKIGILGSAFNPPTLGHLDVLEQARQAFDLILLVPNAAHAFSKSMLPFHHRVAMCQQLVNSVQLPQCQIEVSDIELKMLADNPEKPVYTFDLLELLEQKYPGDQLGFIRGPDNADPRIWKRFYRSEDIEQRWQVFTARERQNIRSTQVRELLVSGSSDDNNKEAVAALLLPSVHDYILQHHLYQ